LADCWSGDGHAAPETWASGIPTCYLRRILPPWAVKRLDEFGGDSDGDNFTNDSTRCHDLLADALLPLCRFFAYVQVADTTQIYPVFRDLFKKEGEGVVLALGQIVIQAQFFFATARVPGYIIANRVHKTSWLQQLRKHSSTQTML